MVIKEEYKFIRKIFKKYQFSYSLFLAKSNEIEKDTIVWSNNYLEFYPYQYELNQLEKPKIYKKEPKSKEGVIINNLIGNEVYYSYHAENVGWGSVFVFNDSERRIYMMFFNNDDDEMVLNQVHFIKHDINDKIEKILFYSKDEEYDEETFMIDNYLYYENGNINSIIRNGFYEEKKNVLETRRFRFEYEDEKILIYSNQINKENTSIEKLLCTLKF